MGSVDSARHFQWLLQAFTSVLYTHLRSLSCTVFEFHLLIFCVGVCTRATKGTCTYALNTMSQHFSKNPSNQASKHILIIGVAAFQGGGG
jgi:hypothetical protein